MESAEQGNRTPERGAPGMLRRQGRLHVADAVLLAGVEHQFAMGMAAAESPPASARRDRWPACGASGLPPAIPRRFSSSSPFVLVEGIAVRRRCTWLLPHDPMPRHRDMPERIGRIAFGREVENARRAFRRPAGSVGQVAEPGLGRVATTPSASSLVHRSRAAPHRPHACSRRPIWRGVLDCGRLARRPSPRRGRRFLVSGGQGGRRLGVGLALHATQNQRPIRPNSMRTPGLRSFPLS